MDYIAVLFGVLGGLGLFLYGMLLLSEGMQKAAGNRVKNLLKKFTDTPLKGVFVGATITGIIQSSSITTVTVVSLINSGVMTLRQAVGIIFGAEIGTTITAQMVAFPVGKFALPIIALGVFIYLTKRRSNGSCGQILIGLGLLFLGMETMKHGVAPLRESEYIISTLVNFGAIPILGVLASAVFTGMIQSSSATTGIIIAMAQENVIDLSSAIPLIMGANIGTCITALIASYGTTKPAKRAALIHLIFNFCGVILFLPLIPIFKEVILLTSTSIPHQIANAHTIFNVTNTLIFLPFSALFILAAKKIIRGKDENIESGTKYLDDHYLDVPSVALESVEREVNHMAKTSYEMLKDSKKILLNNKTELSGTIYRKEDIVDDLLKSIGIYSIKLSQKQLSRDESKKLSALVENVTDIERVADHVVNMTEAAERMDAEGIKFSKKTREELEIILDNTLSIYHSAVMTVETNNPKKIKRIMELEDIIDRNEKEFKQNQIIRLGKNKRGCNPALSIMFTDILHNLERIGDHSVNMVERI